MPRYQWFAEVKRLAGIDWEYISNWYSFNKDYADGLTPDEALSQAIFWTGEYLVREDIDPRVEPVVTWK